MSIKLAGMDGNNSMQMLASTSSDIAPDFSGLSLDERYYLESEERYEFYSILGDHFYTVEERLGVEENHNIASDCFHESGIDNYGLDFVDSGLDSSASPSNSTGSSSFSTSNSYSSLSCEPSPVYIPTYVDDSFNEEVLSDTGNNVNPGCTFYDNESPMLGHPWTVPLVEDAEASFCTVYLEPEPVEEAPLESQSLELRLSHVHHCHTYSKSPYDEGENSEVQQLVVPPAIVPEIQSVAAPEVLPTTSTTITKRRPGRPKSSKNSVEIPKVAPRKIAKKGKASSQSSVKQSKRLQHNQSERNRRNDLKSNTMRLMEFVPEELLRAAAMTITLDRSERTEEIENSFAVNIMQKMDELVKKGIAKSHQRGKKNNSKMVVLLATTYFYSLLEKDLKSKETFIRNENSNYFRSRQSKRVKQ